MAVALPACNSSSSGNDRWVTTENTNVEIDWDAVAKAYREADGPEDLEKRVNEIYTGSEVISIAVHDVDERTQEVTGFFDKNASGSVDEGEKVFSIKRELEGDNEAQYRVRGHGYYSSYHSPMMSIASGMLMGHMLSRVFSPGYRPMYTQPYHTPVARRSQLTSHRDGYRKANPSKFRKGAKSRSGRQYGRQGGAFGGGKPSRTRSRPSRSRGGGRFGLGERGSRRVVRLA